MIHNLSNSVLHSMAVAIASLLIMMHGAMAAESKPLIFREVARSDNGIRDSG